MSRLDNFEEILKSYEGREFVSPVSFNDLEWQPKAYREPNEIRNLWKGMLCFDDSQKELVKAGYERHPLSAEAFGLIIAHLEGKLPQELDKIAEDLLSGPGEFFCQVIKTRESKSIIWVYEPVTALPRNAAKDGYDFSKINFSRARNFDVSDLEFGSLNYLKNICDEHNDLIEHLTSRRFEDLPDEIKETGVISLPEPGDVWPIGRSGFNIKYGIDGLGGDRASRGVRRMQNSFKDSKGFGT